VNKKMKKAALLTLLSISLLIVVFLAPAIASPTQGKKETVVISWGKGTAVPNTEIKWETPSGVVHREVQMYFANVQIFIGDSTTPLKGFAYETRYAEWNQEGLNHRSCHRYYEISILGQDLKTVVGTFEGNSKLLIDDYVSAASYTVMAHGVFHGTGLYDGQMINAGEKWTDQSTVTWTGYILIP
jgi:hypothetical protein